jgi:hypothetical protein
MVIADEIRCERLEGMEEELTGYALGLAKTLQFIWNHVGQRVVENIDTFNRRVKKPLIFKPYEVGDYSMLRRTPKRFLRGKKRPCLN